MEPDRPWSRGGYQPEPQCPHTKVPWRLFDMTRLKAPPPRPPYGGKRGRTPETEPHIPTPLEDWDSEFERIVGYKPTRVHPPPKPEFPKNIDIRMSDVLEVCTCWECRGVLPPVPRGGTAVTLLGGPR